MKPAGSLPRLASLDDYEREALDLLAALERGDRDVAWRFKWEHPGFRGKSVTEVDPAGLDLADARLVIAQEHAFHDWRRLQEFVAAMRHDQPLARFEAAVDAIVEGDLDGLRNMLHDHPELARARATRRHHATLLHYVAANGVEHGRQKTPANAVEICRLLLEAGAEPDALADMYDARCTTLSMLVSSSPPDDAGLQIRLAETLLDHGAALEGPGSQWQSAVLTALVFNFPMTAEALARRGPVTSFVVACGLGRIEDVRRLLPAADPVMRHQGFSLAAQRGRADVVRLLLEAGEDPDRFNADGFHSHATPLHQAVGGNHEEVVRLLLERGARLDLRDGVYGSTPLGWALHGRRDAIADLLRAHGARE